VHKLPQLPRVDLMLRYLWIALIIVALDQATKIVAYDQLRHGEIVLLPFLNLALAFNTGAAFSFLADAGGWQNLFFVGVAIVVSIIILMMSRRLGTDEVQVAVGLMLVLGGAIGNLIDRVRLGYVVDFIDVYYKSWHFPTFNVADSAITIGAVLLILDAFGITFRRRSD
jgi:signal peptidase II